MQAKLLANPANGVVDVAILVGPEIEDVHLAIRPIEGGKDCADAILHVQIRLPLVAVAQYVEPLRVPRKLPAKSNTCP